VCDKLRKKTIEDYIELVFNLQKTKKRVHTNDIANALNINPASVTEIFQKLSDEGLVNYKKYSGIVLTEKGRKLALKTKGKHEKLKEFLIILGIDKDIAESDACEMEHILHPSTMNMIDKFVEIIGNCKITPFWLNRLKRYVKTGKLPNCPDELYDICLKYSKIKE
jgi:DtxR family Mn-dependent transcriptional regulator